MFCASTFSTLPEVSAGDAPGIRREDREVAIPTRRQISTLHLIDLVREVGVLGPVRVEQRRPPASSGGALRPDTSREMLAHAF